MALFDPGMPCSLCGKPLNTDDDLFATTFVGLDSPYNVLDDSVAHQECVDNWGLKEAFVAEYNAAWRKPRVRIDKSGHVVWIPDGRLTDHPVFLFLMLPLALVLWPFFKIADWMSERKSPVLLPTKDERQSPAAPDQLR